MPGGEAKWVPDWALPRRDRSSPDQLPGLEAATGTGSTARTASSLRKVRCSSRRPVRRTCAWGIRRHIKYPLQSMDADKHRTRKFTETSRMSCTRAICQVRGGCKLQSTGRVGATSGGGLHREHEDDVLRNHLRELSGAGVHIVNQLQQRLPLHLLFSRVGGLLQETILLCGDLIFSDPFGKYSDISGAQKATCIVQAASMEQTKGKGTYDTCFHWQRERGSVNPCWIVKMLR